MNRRSFVNLTAAVLIGTMAGALPGGFDRYSVPTEYDKYGGWIWKKFNATGFFRVEKDNRWWIVTPEGNAFLSFGINHFFPDLFKGKHNYKQWEQKLKLDDINDNHTFQPALRNWFLQTCREFGFNTIGAHNNLDIANAPRSEMPYIQDITFIDIAHYKSEIPDENFHDVFSDDFVQHCQRLSEKIIPNVKNDPYFTRLFYDRLSAFYRRRLSRTTGYDWGSAEKIAHRLA